MKGRIFIAVILIFLTSCEKGETDDTILKFFSKAFKDSGNSIAIGENGYYICGQMTDKLSTDATKKAGIIKTGLDGNLMGKVKTLGGSEGSASKVIVVGNSVVCTGYVLDNAAQKDVMVFILNSDLTSVIDSMIYQSPGNQYGVDIIKTQEGFLILGTTDVAKEPFGEETGNAAGKKDILLMRIRDDLEPLAPIPAVGYIGNDEGAAIKADVNGGYMVVGTTDRSDRPSGEQSGNNIFLFRVNSDGSTTQPRIVGGTSNEYASDFEVVSDGYLIAGTIGNAGTTQQGYIWKMPLDIYDEPENEHIIDIDPSITPRPVYSIKAMCRYKTSTFLLAGQHGTGLSARMLVFSVDAYGSPVEGYKKTTGGTGTQISNDVVSDESDNIITVGSNSYENNSMICFLKFRF